MRSAVRWCRRAAAAVACFIALGAGARADEVADFYKGRTVTIVVAHETGTGFDIYARAFARHLARHIPGGPSTVIQNMPGAGGITAGNWLYNVAPKDGTVIATIVHAVLFDHLLGEGGGKYDPAKLRFIGNMEQSVSTCVVTERSGIASAKDLIERESVFGGVSSAGALSQATLALKNLAGARIKLVQGYKGSSDLRLAMQRGEIEGMCGIPVSTLKTQWRDDVESGRFKPILQINHTPRPELKGIAHLYDLARTDEDRKVFDLIFGALVFGRLYIAPPDIPSARFTALRRAFDRAIADPEFLADAAKAQLEITPMTGEEVEALYARYVSVGKDIVARARAAIRQ